MNTLKDGYWIHRKCVYGYTKERVQGWVKGYIKKLGSMEIFMDMYGNIWIHLKMGIGYIENGSMDTLKSGYRDT